MFFKRTCIAVCIALAFFVPQGLRAQISADTIVERTLRALGGRDRINEIEVLYREGELTIGMPNVEGLENAEHQRKFRTWWIPFKGIKTEIEDDKSIIGSVFTLKEGHRYNITLPSKEVAQFENAPAYELATMMKMFNKMSFIPELCVNTYNDERNTQMKGYEHIEDKRCFKLTYGGQHTIYVEEKTYLPLKFLQTFYDEKNKTSSFVEYYFSDYQPTNTGLLLPTVIEQMRRGNDIPLLYRYTQSVVNANISRDEQEVFSVSDIKKKHDEYVEKMGKLLKEEIRTRKRPTYKVGVDTGAQLQDAGSMEQKKPEEGGKIKKSKGGGKTEASSVNESSKEDKEVKEKKDAKESKKPKEGKKIKGGKKTQKK